MGRPSALKCWLEAMRLRTLPVSVAGVAYAAGLSVASHHVCVAALVLCGVFAVLAQVASNFANEYYDYRDGLDKAGRVGPRRGVAEGDISPRAMLTATFLTLGVACGVGCTLVWLYGAWWMYAAGIVTAVAVTAYSAGPFPLSRHGLGEAAVVCFFGVVPVCLTYILNGGEWGWWLLAASIGIGLMGANVLIVNNYRDREDDLAAGKKTLAVRLGLQTMGSLYMANGFMAVLLTMPTWMELSRLGWIPPCVYLLIHMGLYHQLTTRKGRELNPLLGKTSMLMLAYALTYLTFSIIRQ